MGQSLSFWQAAPTLTIPWHNSFRPFASAIQACRSRHPFVSYGLNTCPYNCLGVTPTETKNGSRVPLHTVHLPPAFNQVSAFDRRGMTPRMNHPINHTHQHIMYGSPTRIPVSVTGHDSTILLLRPQNTCTNDKMSFVLFETRFCAKLSYKPNRFVALQTTILHHFQHNQSKWKFAFPWSGVSRLVVSRKTIWIPRIMTNCKSTISIGTMDCNHHCMTRRRRRMNRYHCHHRIDTCCENNPSGGELEPTEHATPASTMSQRFDQHGLSIGTAMPVVVFRSKSPVPA